MTDSLLFQIQMGEHTSLLCGGEQHDNLFLILSQLILHIIIPPWQLTVHMHQIGSLICSKHNKQMVKVTILFLLCKCQSLKIFKKSAIEPIFEI